ncbi:MAG TPA: hypothetical protein VJ718_03455, partial [Candidatus Binataceae bacterium]|nr:hypothetical protein [Candidatus Binataceae bacterium]
MPLDPQMKQLLDTMAAAKTPPFHTLAPAEARRRLDGDMPMVCHAPAVARRLEMASFAALDLLELFAFVRPAQFCVPTPRGLTAALGLAPP